MPAAAGEKACWKHRDMTAKANSETSRFCARRGDDDGIRFAIVSMEKWRRARALPMTIAATNKEFAATEIVVANTPVGSNSSTDQKLTALITFYGGLSALFYGFIVWEVYRLISDVLG